jgi:acetyl-CoA acetyltransferase
MRDVAIVSFAQHLTSRDTREDVEMCLPIVREAIEKSGIPRKSIGFTVSGSSDYLIGRPFSFVGALDAAGPWPPIEESHVEMDGAFALYEAWVRLQHGDIDSAVVYCFGRSSLGDINEVLTAQLDPYLLGPLAPDAVVLAGLQAQAMKDAGRFFGSIQAPPVTDGAAAIVLVAGDAAKKAASPVWIRGIDQRIEAHSLGVRDLTRSISTELAGRKAGVDKTIEVAELHAPFAHQEIIVRDALGLSDTVRINPSGGALKANPVMVAGMIRIGEAANAIWGGAKKAVAHATSGPCLQQNLVCVLEGGAR